MNAAARTEEILGLAKSRAPADRERLLAAVIDLCEASDADEIRRSAPIQTLLNSIFLTLVVEAERDIRRRLAEKLATAAWAPAALINVLALDDVEIARPVIASSPVLQDQDLIRLLVEATIEHQIEVARRPRLGPTVVEAIIQASEPAVLTALADNPHVLLDPDQMATLVATARRVASLRGPLVRRPELDGSLAEQLYLWVGQALRRALAIRFKFNTDGLDDALAEAVDEAHAADRSEPDELMVWTRGADREEMERRLIAKLDTAGQLRPGYLLRALREHRLSLFAGALAKLGRYEPDEVRKALDSDKPELLALACAGVGIDRSVFPTVLELVRSLNTARPGGGAEGARRAQGAFGPFSADIAAMAFKQAIAAV